MYQVPKSNLYFDVQSTTKWLKKENIPFDIYANRWTDATYFNICIPSIEDSRIDIGFSPYTYGYQLGQFEMLVDDVHLVVRLPKETVAYIKDYLCKSK